jgi:hypothetical protein
MEYKHPDKIIVIGPPSTGTTAVVELLHWVGFYTGFKDYTVDNIHAKSAPKGLEWIRDPWQRRGWNRKRKNENFDMSPVVIKSPIGKGRAGRFPKKTLIQHYAGYGWNIQHVIFTVREWNDYFEAQRRSLTRRNRKNDTASVYKRIEPHMYLVYREITDIVRAEYPLTMLEYPRWCQDKEYCFRKLSPLMTADQCEKFEEAYLRTVDSSKITIVK